MQPSGDRLDAPFREDVNRKAHWRRPCPRSPNLKATREKQPCEKPGTTIALRGLQRAPGTGKLPAHYSNRPPWKTQLPTVLPHSGRRLPRPLYMHRSVGTIHRNQIQETIVPASLVTSWQMNAPATLWTNHQDRTWSYFEAFNSRKSRICPRIGETGCRNVLLSMTGVLGPRSVEA